MSMNLDIPVIKQEGRKPYKRYKSKDGKICDLTLPDSVLLMNCDAINFLKRKSELSDDTEGDQKKIRLTNELKENTVSVEADYQPRRTL